MENEFNFLEKESFSFISSSRVPHFEAKKKNWTKTNGKKCSLFSYMVDRNCHRSLQLRFNSFTLLDVFTVWMPPKRRNLLGRRTEQRGRMKPLNRLLCIFHGWPRVQLLAYLRKAPLSGLKGWLQRLQPCPHSAPGLQLKNVHFRIHRTHVVIDADRRLHSEHERHFNAPACNEVASVIHGEEYNSCDIVMIPGRWFALHQ
ncbi:E4.1.1.18 [Acanthosepion pharaonis]|uniref:E4.1.1.18 n=1 Tax=Acanthosepion pharaonis TaxID=158019 RepID=A0A812BXA2_ACAPH|nr:E4.1.1.18 [Sepia pharaonis]